MDHLSIGQKATRSITLTAEHVKSYAEMTGDRNPLHFDEDFVSKTKFKKLGKREVLPHFIGQA